MAATPVYLGKTPSNHFIKMVETKYINRWLANTTTNERGCLLFQGCLRNGYARSAVRENGVTRYVSVHIEVYIAQNGEYDRTLDLDHLCRNRNCINSDHLEPVTRQVNVIRGEGVTAVNALKTRCVRGHELSADNLVQDRGRRCLVCTRAKWHRNKNNYKRGTTISLSLG